MDSASFSIAILIFALFVVIGSPPGDGGVAYASGCAGHVTESAIANNTPPAIALIDSDGSTFENGSTFVSADIRIVCLAFDETASIVSVQYSLDDEPFQTVSSDDLHVTNISLTGLTAGAHNIAVKVISSEDLTTEKRVEFMVDLSAQPDVAHINPAVWSAIAGMIALTGIFISIILVWMNWKKSPPKERVWSPPRMPPYI